jgi:hypothetical protein
MGLKKGSRVRAFFAGAEIQGTEVSGVDAPYAD